MSVLGSAAMVAGLAVAGVIAHEIRDPETRKKLAGLRTRDLGFRNLGKAKPQDAAESAPAASVAGEMTDAEQAVPQTPRPPSRAGFDASPQEYLYVSGAGFAMAIAGVVVPVLGPLSVVPTAYSAVPYMKHGIERLVAERYPNVDVLEFVLLCSLLALPSYSLAAFNNVTAIVPHVLLKRLQDESETELADVFGDDDALCSRIAGNSMEEVPREELRIGDIVLVRAGQTVPVDGIVIGGAAALDTHKLTGEQMLAEVGAGDQVLASSFVASGEVRVRAEAAGADTQASKLSQILLNGARYRDQIKLRSEAFADRMTPATLAVGLAAVPALGLNAAAGLINSTPGIYYRISGPTALLRASTLAARAGILVKDGRALEEMGDVDRVVFDKTGTLTTETLVLREVHAESSAERTRILQLAAALERDQPHPIARAIVDAAGELGMDGSPPHTVTTVRGLGVTATIDGSDVMIGSERLMRQMDVPVPETTRAELDRLGRDGNTAVMVAIDGEIAGLIELEPHLRPEARAIIDALHDLGLKTAIISGDRRSSTEALAARLGIDEVYAETLPQHKSEIIENMQADGHKVCFVGDGINDTAALRQANVSVSIAGATDLATETAQVILSQGGLVRLVTFARLARQLAGRQAVSKWATAVPPAASVATILTLGTGVLGSFVANQAALWGGVAVAAFWKMDEVPEFDIATDAKAPPQAAPYELAAE